MAQEINHHAGGPQAATQSASTQPTPHAQSKPKSGLAIAGFVLAIVAVATSFIPIVNNLSALVAVVGFVLAIVGTVSCAKGNRDQRRGVRGRPCHAVVLFFGDPIGHVERRRYGFAASGRAKRRY